MSAPATGSPTAAPIPALPMLNSPRLQLRPPITAVDRARFRSLLDSARARADWHALPARAARCWLIEAKFASLLVGFVLLSSNAPRHRPQAWLWLRPEHRDQGYGSAALGLLHREFPRLRLDPAGEPRLAAWLMAQGGLRDRRAGWRLAQGQTPGRALPTEWQECIDACALSLGVPADYAERHRLAPVPEPERLHYAGPDYLARSLWLRHDSAKAWIAMRALAAGAGIQLEAVSGFRSIAYQAAIVRRKLGRGLGIDEILKVNTAPGYSEHHSGCALDIGTPGTPPAEECFEHTAAFAWLKRHAGQFGFRLSYPRDNPHGVVYEPWHWCRVGW